MAGCWEFGDTVREMRCFSGRRDGDLRGIYQNLIYVKNAPTRESIDETAI